MICVSIVLLPFYTIFRFRIFLLCPLLMFGNLLKTLQEVLRCSFGDGGMTWI